MPVLVLGTTYPPLQALALLRMLPASPSAPRYLSANADALTSLPTDLEAHLASMDPKTIERHAHPAVLLSAIAAAQVGAYFNPYSHPIEALQEHLGLMTHRILAHHADNDRFSSLDFEYFIGQANRQLRKTAPLLASHARHVADWQAVRLHMADFANYVAFAFRHAYLSNIDPDL